MMATRSRPSLYAATGTWPYPIWSDSPSRKTSRRCSTFGSLGSVRKFSGGTPVAGGWSGSMPCESSLWICPRQTESNVSSVSPKRICSSPLCSTVQPGSVPQKARSGCASGTFGPTRWPMIWGGDATAARAGAGSAAESSNPVRALRVISDSLQRPITRLTFTSSRPPSRNDATHDGMPSRDSFPAVDAPEDWSPVASFEGTFRGDRRDRVSPCPADTREPHAQRHPPIGRVTQLCPVGQGPLQAGALWPHAGAHPQGAVGDGLVHTCPTPGQRPPHTGAPAAPVQC